MHFRQDGPSASYNQITRTGITTDDSFPHRDRARHLRAVSVSVQETARGPTAALPFALAENANTMHGAARLLPHATAVEWRHMRKVFVS